MPRCPPERLSISRRRAAAITSAHLRVGCSACTTRHRISRCAAPAAARPAPELHSRSGSRTRARQPSARRSPSSILLKQAEGGTPRERVIWCGWSCGRSLDMECGSAQPLNRPELMHHLPSVLNGRHEQHRNDEDSTGEPVASPESCVQADPASTRRPGSVG